MKYLFIASLFLLLIACKKPAFYPDPYNPGLSRFTSRDYDVASVYINDSTWISDLNSIRSMGIFLTSLHGGTSGSSSDTLNISWSGSFGSADNQSWQNYSSITFSIPVKNNFTKADFLIWNGKLFPDNTTPVKVSLSYVPDFISSNHENVVGEGKIYFVKLVPESNGFGNGIAISGLFEGNIGDSIILRKGRFDFSISSDRMYLP